MSQWGRGGKGHSERLRRPGHRWEAWLYGCKEAWGCACRGLGGVVGRKGLTGISSKGRPNCRSLGFQKKFELDFTNNEKTWMLLVRE